MAKEKYKRTVIRAGRTVEIRETYPTVFGDELTREKHSVNSHTPEAMKQYNDELRTRRLTLLINENFVPDDYWVTLHYEKENRPKSYDAANTILSRFVPKLKKLYNSQDIELKYIKCTAFGERGGVHHHIILPQGVSQREISRLWKEHIKASIKARPPSFVALYSTGEYSSIAAYMVKQKQCIDDEEEQRFIKKWVGSRNLKKPLLEKVEEIEKIKWKEPPVAWNGYYIETDSIQAGCNPVTGRPYLFYRMVKLPPTFVCYDDKGKRLTGKTAIKFYRENNKRFIVSNWIDLNPEGEIIFKNKRKDE